MSISQTAGETGGLVECGAWRLLKEAGRGAYGTVYLAEGPGGRRAAVKVCRKEAAGPGRYGRELRGAKHYKTLPAAEGLVRMLELAEADWGFWYAMDLADDESGAAGVPAEQYRPKTLAKAIEGEKALSLKECAGLGIALAKGLATLQRHHLLHRDIKPGNVIYVGGRPVLSDPGLLVEEAESGSVVGTPGFVPPENFTAAGGDVYSLGLTLKAASFGRSVEELDKGPAQEADTGARLFPAWWRILNKATDPVPARRYRSAKALLKDLKLLRARMAVARCSWLVKTAIAGMLAAAAAYAYASYRERVRMAAEMESSSGERKRMAAEMESSTRERERMAAEMESSTRERERMAAEIKSLKSVRERMSAEIESSSSERERLTAEIESANRKRKKLEAQVKPAKEIADQLQQLANLASIKKYMDSSVDDALYAYKTCVGTMNRYYFKIKNSSDAAEKEKMEKALTELKELRMKMRKVAVKLYILKLDVDDAIRTLNPYLRHVVDKKILSAHIAVVERAELEERVLEILRATEGKDENWKPNPNWVRVQGSYWDLDEIFKTAEARRKKRKTSK